jgi:hypothetical protein
MPEKQTIERAKKAKRKGKSAGTQSGEFVREEMHHIREGKHGARSTKQAIAIGLSKARRAGVALSPPKRGRVSEKTRRSAERAYESGRKGKSKVSPRRSRATGGALKRERRAAASRQALSRQARSAAGRSRTLDGGTPSSTDQRSRGTFSSRAQGGARPRPACLTTQPFQQNLLPVRVRLLDWAGDTGAESSSLRATTARAGTSFSTPNFLYVLISFN